MRCSHTTALRPSLSFPRCSYGNDVEPAPEHTITLDKLAEVPQLRQQAPPTAAPKKKVVKKKVVKKKKAATAAPSTAAPADSEL